MTIRFLNEEPKTKSTIRYLDDSEPQEILSSEVQQLDSQDKFKGFRGAKFSELAEVVKGTPEGKEVEQRLGQEIKVGITRFAPFVIPIGRGVKVASKLASPIAKMATKAGTQATQAAGINAGSRFAEELSKGESVDKSIKDATDAGVGAGAVFLALPVVGGGVKKLAEKIAPFTKKAVSSIEEILTSVPRDDVYFALNEELSGRSIFKGAFDSKRAFSVIGKRVQKSINHLNKEAGKEVGIQRTLLKNTNVKLNTNSIIKNIDNMIEEKSFQGVSSLAKKDIKIINQFKKELESDSLVHVAKLHVIKNKINNSLSKNAFDKQTVGAISSEGEGIIKKTASEINEYISNSVDSYKKANEKFSKVRTIRDRLKNKLKDENVERNIKNLYKKDTFTQGLFEELDELSPKGLKFQSKLKRAVVRDMYQEIASGKGGGSGSSQGILNLMRGGFIAGAYSAGGGAGTLAAAALVSPSIGGKATVKALGAAPRMGRALGSVSRLAIPLGGMINVSNEY